MDLYKFDIPKAKVLAIPRDELLFFIQLTNLANEISVLDKLVLRSMEYSARDPIAQSAQNSQAVFLIRTTAGKLWEGWQLLQTHYFATSLSRDYRDLHTADGLNHLRSLKTYFSGSCLIKQIRDKFAFHVSRESSEALAQQIAQVSDTDILSLYLSRHYGNCFYQLSYTLLFAALLQTIGQPTTEAGIRVLLKDVIRTARHFHRFVADCVRVFGKRHLGTDPETITISDPPGLEDSSVSYFIARPPRARPP